LSGVRYLVARCKNHLPAKRHWALDLPY